MELIKILLVFSAASFLVFGISWLVINFFAFDQTLKKQPKSRTRENTPKKFI
ncbi:hypothetical protein ES703_50192 [subsurface metagenome]